MTAIKTLRVITLSGLCLLAIGLSSLASAQSPRVLFETTQGNFTVELNAEKAPKSVENFLKYVTDKHYDGTIFHRVIPGFVAQAGGHTADMSEKPTRAPIVNEGKNGLRNELGTLSMARTSAPDSATSQFYINLANNRSLDYPSPDGVGYAVFGKVVEGMEVIGKIAKARTGFVRGMSDVPQPPIVITRARLLTAPAKAAP